MRIDWREARCIEPSSRAIKFINNFTEERRRKRERERERHYGGERERGKHYGKYDKEKEKKAFSYLQIFKIHIYLNH
jgi:hypothetical protein